MAGVPKGQVKLLPCTRDVLLAAFGEDAAVEYLHIYLADMKAGAIYVEGHYVDRHFLDDFARYYALSFTPPSSFCQRLHFFACTPEELDKLIAAAYAAGKERAAQEEDLHKKYIGFVVRRPLGASIGRTVLDTYPAQNRRRYEAVRPYEVNLNGLKLGVKGLAYQQQDGGVAVCASTALWSALQRVAFMSGQRTPTPAAITEAAQSPFPASDGLSTPQMAAALSNLGYIADHFAPEENRALFRAKVGGCLQSQLPVILLLSRTRETGAGTVTVGHAVTATGYSEPAAITAVPTARKGIAPIRMKAGSLEDLYVHDDNLGSHAHYKFFDVEELNEAKYKKLMLRRGLPEKPIPKWEIDEWEVVGALVPKPEWHRLSMETLVHEILAVRPLFEETLFKGLALHWNVRFASGVEFKRELFSLSLNPAAFRAFQESLTLPRYVGVIECFIDDNPLPLCSTILDVSEVKRGPLPSILAMVAPGVPLNSPAALILDQGVCRPRGWSLITGP